MQVFLESEDEEKNIEFTGTVTELLAALGINPESVLVARGNELLVKDDQVENSDELRILSVISGG